MKNIKEQIKAYEEILAVVAKYGTPVSPVSYQLNETNVEFIIENLKISERFGIELKSYQGNYLHKQVVDGYDNWCGIGFYGSEGMEISWPDCGNQPNNEYLYKLSFGCGPYIFTSGYPSDENCPRETFKAFFEELKSYSPAFVDSANNTLYFRDDIAKIVHGEFPATFKKYKALVDAELKEKRRAELQRELESLE